MNESQHYYAILGLAGNASLEQIQSAFEGLRDRLSASRFEAGSKADKQAASCLERCRQAFAVLSDPDRKAAYDRQIEHSETDSSTAAGTTGTTGTTRPRLGQLCVASGMISMNQLEEAVEAQIATGLPLGEILEEKRFISGVELEGLLLGQDLIDIQASCTDPLGQRLVALGIASEDMILIAQMEARAQDAGIGDVLTRRGWIEGEIISALL
ncbi:MAG: hypothetical protein KC777_10345 [Cyanobacteria bacterium HKST-UBA02]|nr:hypothetical protein [Cyanobacteria bacterium HKST-UBA02]